MSEKDDQDVEFLKFRSKINQFLIGLGNFEIKNVSKKKQTFDIRTKNDYEMISILIQNEL